MQPTQLDPNKRLIILDTETTGLYPNHAENPDRLIEFAGLEMKNRQLTGNNLHLLVHPQRDIPEEASAVHNITLDQLVDKPIFAQVAQQIFDFINGAELVIHNAKFDVAFLNAEFDRVGLPKVETICDITDTLEMARERYPGQKNNLDALCNRLSVDRSKRVYHGALIDCELLGEVYLAMTRGQFSLMGDLDDGEENSPQMIQLTEKFERTGSLKIIYADENELAAHEAVLDDLDKSVGGRCLYRADLPIEKETETPPSPPPEPEETEEDEEEHHEEIV